MSAAPSPGAAANADDTPVAIVGAGTAGSVLALLLARRGVRSVLIERRTEADAHPRGHVWSVRSMEVLRSIDPELAEEMRESSPAPLKLRYITWCTSLAGVDLGRCVPIGNDPAYTAHLLASSPCRPLHLSQNVADPILRQRVLAEPSITLLAGCELQALTQGDSGCTLRLHEAASGRTHTVYARYAVGADGAESTVRRLLGLESTVTPLQSVAQIHFRAQLGRFTAPRPGPLYWVLNPTVVGTLTAHTADDTEWVLTTAALPAVEPPEAMSEARARALVQAAIGDTTVPVQIVAARSWAMDLRQARTVRQGRVMLVGDAAAGFSAIGGFGLNHGIQDAASLAWRLCLLTTAPLQAGPAEALLTSFAAERADSARHHAERTLRLTALSDEVLLAAGLDPAGFGKLTALSESRLLKILPRSAVMKLFAALLSGGLRPTARLASTRAEGALARQRVAQAIAKQREVFVTLGTDLGYAVTNGFVTRARHPLPTAPHSATEYWPTTTPGALIPHLWSRSDHGGPSTRDLARAAPLTLLVWQAQRPRWLAALAQVRAEWGIDVACPSVGTTSGDDFQAGPADWAAALQIDPEGAVLVRGDGVVAWRARSDCTDPGSALRDVFKRLLQQTVTTSTAPNPNISEEVQ
jgi:2-polyprenyl-6-methoxyphenol hydroxylase-like FAD-dependent oxidoreductase